MSRLMDGDQRGGGEEVDATDDPHPTLHDTSSSSSFSSSSFAPVGVRCLRQRASERELLTHSPLQRLVHGLRVSV